MEGEEEMMKTSDYKALPAVMSWCVDCLGWASKIDECEDCCYTGLDPIPWTELFMVGVGYGGFKP